MLSYEDTRLIIADALYANELINERLYEKCKKPSYITSLTGDLRSTSSEVLHTRLDEIDEALDKREQILKDADYRLGVKLRDSERLSKRVDKHISNMDKAVDNINKESGKIVKDIETVESKIKSSDMEKSLKDDALSRIKDLKKAHNNLFSNELTGGNIVEYRGDVGSLSARNSSLHNHLLDLYNGGLISKSDLNKADCGKNISRILKNIDKFEKSSKDMSRDVTKIQDNQGDIDYLSEQMSNVQKQYDDLMDEFERTYNHTVDLGLSPVTRERTANPLAIVNFADKPGDHWTFLPRNWDKYIAT